ncbi:DUF4861 domain-containing protein [Pedobacter changchengzhani]|uniref:DUF4861 domain-containing protein n=2 Tax=Pedobacter changchengzhani TaxID=2529274 RepID=A0A4R5ML87_9SPHI|nr:DUF4861 domain-containing protein [Pedobacter changchengzhani]
MKIKMIRFFLVAFAILTMGITNACVAHNKGAFIWTNGSRHTNLIDSAGLLVKVKNTLSTKRTAQTIALDWKRLCKKVKNATVNNIVVYDAITNKQIPSQVLYKGKKSPQDLIFQTDISAETTLNFIIRTGTRDDYKRKTFGRQVPERFDDFAWENDVVAFRMYGAALETQPDNAKGLDVWSKNTPELVLNKWYKEGDYHTNHGLGMDGYKVGFSLGAGDSAPLIGDKFIFPKNYDSYKIIDEGPIRLTFELNFSAWNVNGQQVTETKRITLDAGSSINKIENFYHFKVGVLPIAVGVTKHSGDGSIKLDNINNYVSYWDKTDGKIDNGMIGVGVIFPAAEGFKLADQANHLLGLKTLRKNQQFVYYQGATWNRGGHFTNEDEWLKYLENYSKNLQQPLIVAF